MGNQEATWDLWKFSIRTKWFPHRPCEILPRRSQRQTSIRTQSSTAISRGSFHQLVRFYQSNHNSLLRNKQYKLTISGIGTARRWMNHVRAQHEVSLSEQGHIARGFHFRTSYTRTVTNDKLTCPVDSIWPNLVVLQLSSIRRQTYILPTVILPLPNSKTKRTHLSAYCYNGAVLKIEECLPSFLGIKRSNIFFACRGQMLLIVSLSSSFAWFLSEANDSPKYKIQIKT